MIWQSIPLMTAFDVLIVTAAIFALGMLARHRRRLRGALLGPAFLVLGLATLAGAYAADLVVMHAPPFVLDREVSLGIMRDIHLNLKWAPITFAAGTLATGCYFMTRRLAGLLHDQTQLSRQLIQAHEFERKAIARDLHDDVGQTLTALQYRLRALGRTHAIPEVPQMIEIVDEAMGAVRMLAADLRPPILDQAGLATALREYVARYERHTDLAVAFTADEAGPRLPPDAEIASYRVVQEALANVARHAEASRVSVTLTVRDTEAVLTVEDDGVGFHWPRLGPGTGVGLRGIRERVDALGGTVGIRSSPGRGTLIRVVLPRRADRSDARPALSARMATAV